MRTALLITLVCLCGCAVQHPPAKRQPLIQSRQIKDAVAQGGASVPASRLVSSLAPPAETATLSWTTSEPTDCIVYSSPDKKWWSPLLRVNGNEATVPATPPQWFYVTAISDDGESLPSNTLGILGKAPVGLQVIGEHAASPDGPWVAYDIPIYDGPADQAMQVFRVKAVKTGGWQTVSEP